MKNTTKLFGIIAIIVVIGFSMTACDLFEKEEEETTSLQGKWVMALNYYEFTGENFTARFSGAGSIRGTFTYTTTHITFFPTHQSNSGVDEWKELNTVSPGSIFYDNGIHGNPVTYRIEKKYDVQLYIGSHTLGYRKQ